MKTTKKLEIKKVTLQDLDEPTLDAMAGGTGVATCVTCATACGIRTCPGRNTCSGQTCLCTG